MLPGAQKLRKIFCNLLELGTLQPLIANSLRKRGTFPFLSLFCPRTLTRTMDSRAKDVAGVSVSLIGEKGCEAAAVGGRNAE